MYFLIVNGNDDISSLVIVQLKFIAVYCTVKIHKNRQRLRQEGQLQQNVDFSVASAF